MDYLCLQLRDSGNGSVPVDLVLQPAPEEEVQGSEVRKVGSSAILHEPPAVRCNQRVVERGEEVCLLRVREGVVHKVGVETVTEQSSVAVSGHCHRHSILLKKVGPKDPRRAEGAPHCHFGGM